MAVTLCAHEIAVDDAQQHLSMSHCSHQGERHGEGARVQFNNIREAALHLKTRHPLDLQQGILNDLCVLL